MTHDPLEGNSAQPTQKDPAGKRYRASNAGTHPRSPDEPPGPNAETHSDPDFRLPPEDTGDEKKPKGKLGRK